MMNTKITGRRIIIYSSNNRDLLMILLRYIAEERIRNVEVWTSLDVTNLEIIDPSFFSHMSEAEIGELTSNYLRYEFSNKLLLVSDDSNYPSLYNFVESGVLSKEEYIQALLMENSYE